MVKSKENSKHVDFSCEAHEKRKGLRPPETLCTEYSGSIKLKQ